MKEAVYPAHLRNSYHCSQWSSFGSSRVRRYVAYQLRGGPAA